MVDGPLIPFGEYRPDVSDFNAQYTANLSNVLPRLDGYGPMPSFQALTSALPAACRGAFYARKTDGTVAIFAGTATDLYLLNNSTFAWSNVSKGGVSYTTLNASALWQFEQFNNYALAVQANCNPQYYDLTSSTQFADLAGSPPAASYIAIVGRFVLLSGLVSLPYRIQWSGLNDPTNWTSGVNSSDFQDFPDGGPVRPCVGGEVGYIFQDQAIRRMVYAPGSDVIFNIDRVAKDIGLLSPYAIVFAGDDVYFLATKGFQKLSGGVVTPIGRERVDRTFFANFNLSNSQWISGAHNPETGSIFWVYQSLSGSSSGFDSGLVYDPVLDRWSPFSLSGQLIFSVARPGLTMEGLDAISGSIDALPFTLDSIANAQTPKIALFNQSNTLGFLTGSNLEAVLETGEQSAIQNRLFVQGFFPATDATAAYGNVTRRENLTATATTTTERAMNARGFVPARADTRYARGRLRIAAGTTWSYAMGLAPMLQRRGRR